MFCPNCGSEIGENEKFCHSCGQSLRDVERPTAPSADAAATQVTPPVDQPTSVIPDRSAGQTDAGGMDEMDRTVVRSEPTMAADRFEAQPTMAADTPSQPTMSAGAQPQPQPALQPNPAQPPEQPKAWYETTPARIAIIVVGLGMMIAGILKIVGVFDKKPSASTSVVASSVADTSSTSSSYGTGFTNTESSSSYGTGFTSTETSSSNDTGFTSTSSSDANSSSTTSEPTDTTSTSSSDSTSSTVTTDQGTLRDKDFTQGRPTTFLDDPELLTDQDRISIYAYLTLEGWQLETLAQKNNYAWYTDYSLWANDADNMYWSITDEDGYWMPEEVADLAAGGKGQPVVFYSLVSGYENAKAVFNDLAHCSTVCSAYAPTGQYLAICYGPTMEQHLVNISDAQDGDFHVQVYNEEAIADGYFTSGTDLDLGTTMEDIFQNYTQKSLDTHE